MNSNEYVLKDSIKVFFDTISSNGIDVKIIFLTSVVDYVEFLKFKDEMNFNILDLAQKNNIELAYDSKTIYLKR